MVEKFGERETVRPEPLMVYGMVRSIFLDKYRLYIIIPIQSFEII